MRLGDGTIVCDFGRTVCPSEPLCPTDLEAAGRVHVIYAKDETGESKVELCDLHFDLVNRAGLISEPYAGRDRVRDRLGREPD